MVELRRTVRFWLDPAGGASPSPRSGSGYTGRPAPSAFLSYHELDLVAIGEPDPKTGYLVDIKVLDDAARQGPIPRLAAYAAATRGPVPPQPEAQQADALQPDAAQPDAAQPDATALLASLAAAAAERLAAATSRGRLALLRWRPGPYHTIEVALPFRHEPDPSPPTEAHRTMTTPAYAASPNASPPRVLLRVRAEFSAAHRLHAPGLSDEQNRALFGKCNNPSGHGHNYAVEAAVSLPASGGGPSLTPAALEALLDRHVVEPFDHKHLNIDTRDFNTDRGGVIPSVENIARVCYDRLAPHVAQLGTHAAQYGTNTGPGAGHVAANLASVTVWETDRTCATYPAQPNAPGHSPAAAPTAR